MYPLPLNLSDLQPFLDRPEQLANQPIPFQIAVANYPQTPRHLLEVLANSTNPQIAQAASLHINLVGEISLYSQEIAEAAIKTATLGQNDRLVAELLSFAPVPDVFISEWIPGHRLIQAIENTHTPHREKVKLLERLARSPIVEERLKAAANAETPHFTLEQLAGDLELPIRIAVKFHPHSPSDLIELVENQHEIAQNWDTEPEELANLANSPWSWIRLAVARNPCTPPEILAKLTQDSEEKIQLAVARNYATPADVLDLLMEHYYQEVTLAIAIHPNASEQALVKLLPHHHYDIIDRPNLPASVLAVLRYNDDYKYIYNNKPIYNPNTPGDALAQLIDAPSFLLKDLAKHPNILVSSLEQLAQKNDFWVCLAVFENPKTPEALKNQLLEQLLAVQDYKMRLALAQSNQIHETLKNQLLQQLIDASENELICSDDLKNQEDLDDEDYFEDDDDLLDLEDE